MSRPISRTMRDVLIRHLDGLVKMPFGRDEKLERTATVQCILKGWLERVVDAPDHTRITADGRAALAAVLADWADAFLRAGYGGAPADVAPVVPPPMAPYGESQGWPKLRLPGQSVPG